MVETYGYTLEEISIAFDGPSGSVNSSSDMEPVMNRRGYMAEGDEGRVAEEGK